MEMDGPIHRRGTKLIPTVQNPFANSPTWTWYEILKGAWIVCWLLFARVTTLMVVCIIEVVVASLAVVGTRLTKDRGCIYHAKPFARWRYWLMAPLQPLNRIALACFGYWPGGIKVNDMRKDKSRQTRILVVAPHMTFLDSLMIAVAFPPVPSGVGFTGILDFPVFRSLAIAAQTVFVDRTDTASRAGCKEIIQMRAQDDWPGPPMMIFPEGVITNGTALIQFKAGAFAPGRPVTPVCLRYPWKHYNPSGCGKNYHVHIAFLRTLLQFANFCQIDILDVYEPSVAEANDPILFASNVRKVMANHLDVPCTEQSYEDARLAHASKAHMGSDFEISELKSLYGFTYTDCIEYLEVFDRFDTKSSGSISYPAFQQVVQTHLFGYARKKTSVENLFAFFDQGKSGAIEFREFAQVASVVLGRSSSVSRVKLAFLIYDLAGDNRVQKTLVHNVLNGSAGSAKMLVADAIGNADENGSVDWIEFNALTESEPKLLTVAMEILSEVLSTKSKTICEEKESKKKA
jgi:lysophosphatidylcholine acyltransferase/lyso-PAF acetyltransferase